MIHRPYKHCKRCARRAYGATHDYHCHATSIGITVTVVNDKIETKETDPGNRNPECMNFCRKIRLILGDVLVNWKKGHDGSKIYKYK